MKKEFIEQLTVTKYRITLEPDEWYCKACCKVHKGSVPSYCPDCGAHWSEYFILGEGEIEEWEEVNDEFGN